MQKKMVQKTLRAFLQFISVVARFLRIFFHDQPAKINVIKCITDINLFQNFDFSIKFMKYSTNHPKNVEKN